MSPDLPPADRAADFDVRERLDPQVVAIMRQKSPAEKIAMIAAARRTALMLAAAGVRYLHPDWSDEEISHEAVRRVSGAAR